MHAPHSSDDSVETDPRRISQRATPGLLAQRTLEALPRDALPAVHLRSVKRHPFLFRKLINRVDDSARPGDLVAVYTPQGELWGHGYYNPRSEMTVRLVSLGPAIPDASFWQQRLEHAVRLRRDGLKLGSAGDAYRVIHAEADGFPGLMVDRYGDTLSAEVFSLAMYQRSQDVLSRLAALLGTQHTLVQVAPQTHGQEGFLADPVGSAGLPKEVIISEFGTRFRVRFTGGHKTGFFCDQRDNRRQLAPLCQGKTVLDLCSYTGGFAVQAKHLGEAKEVTAVDLDEHAIELVRENARLNQVRVTAVHADAFGYMRDMQHNGRQYDIVVLDPPKLIRSRRELDEGVRKHLDLNRLALPLVAPGGLLLTCTCSGLLGRAEFRDVLQQAARQGIPQRSVQILDWTGAAADHPVALDCPETEYLQAAWLRVI